ncbi:MAG: SDR family oxidoreductase [Betaproteobacteria bacterium]|nr:SDR family oxidoreductase [Betaproteobacteria bacterium]
MTSRFENKHVVVTGGARGIGRCISEAFLREGAAITIIDLDKQAGEQLQRAATSEKLRFYHGDIAEKDVLERFVKSLGSPVNCLVNNACLNRCGLLSACSYDDFEYVQRVGVTAPYYLTSLLLRTRLLSPDAAIVNIASTRAWQSQPNTESYSAAKGGIIALTHAMAISLAGKARVNSISPGWIEIAAWQESRAKDWADLEHSEQDKRQHPAGRVGKPEDIAEMALYLCSDKAGFITGENIIVDGGMSRLMVYHNDYGWALEKQETGMCARAL